MMTYLQVCWNFGLKDISTMHDVLKLLWMVLQSAGEVHCWELLGIAVLGIAE